MQELPEALDLIAVGAHPDDVEIGCGGTLASLSRQGYRIGIVDLTDGEPTPLSPGPETRLAEARKAAEILGVTVRETLDLPNRRLFDSYESRVELAKVFRRYRPKIVLGIADKTPLASPDHWQAMQITDAAVFYSRLTKWEGEFEELPVHTVSRQLWYPLGLRQMPSPTSSGSLITDISDTLEVKLEAIHAYETQFPASKAHVFELVRSQSHYYGAKSGFHAGELLYSPMIPGVRDLVHSVL